MGEKEMGNERERAGDWETGEWDVDEMTFVVEGEWVMWEIASKIFSAALYFARERTARVETPGEGWELGVNGVESRMIRTSCPINIKQPNELILKLTMTYLPAKSTRLIKDVFAVSSPASFFLFCVNVTPTIVCARLKIRQQ